VRLRGRRKAPGRPITYGTTEAFLFHFGLESVADLPGLDELKGAGLFDGRLPAGFGVPLPSDDADLRDDEEPLDGEELFDEDPATLIELDEKELDDDEQENPDEDETGEGGRPRA